MVQVAAGDGALEEALDGLIDAGAAAVWSLGAEPSVEVRRGVPVVRGLPPLSEDAREGLALRLYVAPEGVPRIDLVALERRGVRWERASDATHRPRLEALAGRSAALDTWVAVGQRVAAVDVLAHGPPPERPPAGVVPLEPLDVGELPDPQRPPRCAPAPPPAGEAVDLGDRLSLLEARLLTEQASPDDPARVRLTWALRGPGPLPPGQVLWYGGGLATPWRGRHVPCEGSWGFEHWSGTGPVLTEEVWLWPPRDARGEARLSLQVLLDGQVQRPPDGGRQLHVGTVRVVPTSASEPQENP